MLESGEKESLVLKISERKLLAALKDCSLKYLSRELRLNLVISEKVKDKFTSLDHDGVEQEAMVRYLLQHVYDAVKDNKMVFYLFLNVIGEFDGGLPGELRREVHNYELPEVVGESQSDVSVGVKRYRAAMGDYRLGDGDVPLLTELLANGSDKLEELGLSLGLHKHQIIQCQKGCSNMVGLSNVLLEWIRNSREPCTVHRLKEALASSTVNLKNVASQLEQYFLKEATKEVSKRPCLDSPVSLAYFSGDKRVATAVSELLEVQATTTNPVRCQWKKNYQPLPESEDCSSTRASLLSDDVTGKSQNGEKMTAHSEYSKYFSNFYKIKKEVPKDSWPPVSTDTFINLALISKRKQTKDDFAYAVQGDMDDIIGPKEKVKFEEVFGQYNSGALILLEGRPGSGKTTLMHKVARDWALKRNILMNAVIVVLVPMRLFRINDKDITLSDIFKMCIRNDEERCKVLYDIEKESGEGVCFIIDGLDEYEHHNDCDTMILKLICKHLLPLAMVIVASRPVGTALVRDEAPVTKRIEVLGFKKDQILEYIMCYYNHDQNMASNLISYLKAHINVYRMCYLPVHTSMICFLYSRLGENIPQTETKIYESFTRFTLLRKLNREKLRYKKIDSLQSLTGDVKEYFNNICKLAFDMTIYSKQVVLQSQTQFPLTISGSDKSSLGLVTVDSTAELFGFEDLYTFLHLTFQEYLAAFYLAGLEDEKQVISKTKDKQANLQMVWKFYCGMVQFKVHSLVLNYIMSNTDLDMLYKIQCAFESQQQIVCDSVLELDKDDTLSFKDHSLIPTDFLAISYVISTTSYIVTTLTFTKCSLDGEGVALFLEKMSSVHLESIKYLGYHKRNCTVAQLKTIKVLLRKLTNLEVLDLDNTELGVEGVKTLTEYTELPNLRTLKIKLPLKKSRQSDNVEVLKMLKFGSTKLVLIQFACPKEKSYIENDAILLEAFSNAICFNSTSRTICCYNGAFQSFSQTSMEYFQRCSKLVLINCGITDDDLKLFVESMSIFTELRTLRLDFNRITGKGETLLSSLLVKVKCTSLEVFSAHCNQIDDSGALAIAKALVRMTNLKILDLQGNPITDNGASALIMTLKDLSEDFHLYVTINNGLLNKSNLRFVKQSLGVICKGHDKDSLCTALKCCTYLQTLDLRNDNIGSDGAVALAEGLKYCTNLQTLDLRNDSIGLDGAVALAEGLKYCTNLQTLDLSSNSISLDGAVALAEGLKYCTNLQTLNLSSNSISLDGAVALAEGLKYCTNLQTLDLSFNYIGSDGAVALAEGLKYCTNLQTLNLSSNSISSDGAVALAEGLKYCTNLQTLNLSDNSIGLDGAVALAEGLKYCTNLQTLNLSDNSIGLDGAVAPAEGLNYCTNLQTLDLSFNYIGSDGAVALAEGLKYCTSLQTLDLKNNGIGSEGAVALAEGLKCCTNLQTLNLRLNSIGSEGAVALAEGLKCCTNLQTLNLESNRIGSDGAVALAEVLKCCTNLQTLNLSSNRIGSDGAVALAEGLKCCTNLQTLDLESNRIGSDGAVALAEGLKCCTNLETLDLSWNSIGSDGAVALAEGLKCCTNLKTLDLRMISIGSDGAVALAEGLKCCTNLQILNIKT